MKRIGNETVVDKRYLFHGTDSLDAVRGISINNFDVRVSGKNATMYGDGAYFARDAKYSHSYTRGPDRLMFMVTVLVGHYTKGDKSYRRPPNKPGSDHELYDSCVNDMTNPSIFIVFDKNQYYPEYLIQYHKLYEEVDPVSYPSSASRATGTVRSSSWRTTPQQSAPAIPPRSVPSSPTDTSFVGTGYTANQNTGMKQTHCQLYKPIATFTNSLATFTNPLPPLQTHCQMYKLIASWKENIVQTNCQVCRIYF